METQEGHEVRESGPRPEAPTKKESLYRDLVWQLVILFALVILLLIWMWGQLGVTHRISVAGWDVYQHEQFNFEVRVPPGWEVREYPDHLLAPVFNIVPEDAPDEGPLDHFTERTHVSIYPTGMPTEGLAGESVPSALTFREDVRSAEDYILTDGRPWATVATFNQYPPSWSQSGFVFSHVVIEDMEVRCLREGEEVSVGVCDPLGMGDTVVRSGRIDTRMRATQEAILSTFGFVDQ
jgi:hypothetical protein